MPWGGWQCPLRLPSAGATAAELVGLHHPAEQWFVPLSITAKEQSPWHVFLPSYVFSILFQVLCPLLTPTVS